MGTVNLIQAHEIGCAKIPGELELDASHKIIQIQIPRKYYSSQFKHRELLSAINFWNKVICRGTDY